MYGDIKKHLAIEPGSDEEQVLDNIADQTGPDWDDLGGSDQTAVEHYLSNYGKDFTGKSWNDVESEVRSACHEIGYANEELIDDGYWTDGDMEPEPNEKLVADYIYFHYFLPSLKKTETEEVATSKFIEVSKKSVEDSDGFMTDYTLYHDTETDKYVTVFGDQDYYKPEDGDFDMEFETAEEANEWFHSYTGFAEGEDFKETPKSVESLKSLLEQLADRDFYHNMKSNWTQEDFELDDKINEKIQDVITQLKEQGVDTTYRMGYPIEYSDEIQKEAEEDKLSNEEWYELHKEEIEKLNEDPNIDFTGTKDDFCLIIRGNDEEPKEESDDFVIDKDIPADELPTDKDLADSGKCPFCTGPITPEQYKAFGMCPDCYDNNVE